MLHWLTRRIYRRRTSAIEDLSRPERLLLVRVDERVGNLITLQSLIDAIRRRWPELCLGLLASARLARVTESLQGLSRLHQLDKRWFFQRPRRWRRVIERVRSSGYQVAIDASAWHEFSYTHAALTWFSGAPVRIGFERGERSGLHSRTVTPGPPAEYESNQRARLLRPLGLDIEAPAVRTTLGCQSVRGWAEWLRAHRVKRPRIGLWAGSRKLERRWPVPFFVQLGRRLQRQLGAHLLVLWGPGEEAIRDEIGSAISAGIVVAPPTELDALAGLLRNLDLLVSNDTGPMHLAVACRTPTVALFASGEPTRWGHPYGFVRNLSTPGRDPAEVGVACRACQDLLRGRGDHDPCGPGWQGVEC